MIDWNNHRFCDWLKEWDLLFQYNPTYSIVSTNHKEDIIVGCGNERKLIIDKDNGWQAIFDELMLFWLAYKKVTMRRTIWSCSENDSSTIKLVTKKKERQEKAREGLLVLRLKIRTINQQLELLKVVISVTYARRQTLSADVRPLKTSPAWRWDRRK